MKPVSAVRNSSSSSKQLRQGSALKYSRRQQPPKPPASSVFGVAMEWIWNAFGYSSSNPTTSRERTSITRARSKSPAITPSSSMEDDWHRAILQQNKLKKNDAEFFDIAQDILLKGNSVTLSGISPSTTQFQQTMNPYIENLLQRKNIEPNDFIEALQYRAGKIPMFVDPDNQSKLISVTNDLASLLHVKPLPDTDYAYDKSQTKLDTDYMSGILDRQASKVKLDSERQGNFFYPRATAPITEASHSKVPPPLEPDIPPFQHPPIRNHQTTEVFMQNRSFPEQANLEQGYRQHQPYDTSAVMPQQSRISQCEDIPSVTSSWPPHRYSTHISPRQWNRRQRWDDEPQDLFFTQKNSTMEDVQVNTPYHLGFIPLDEEKQYDYVTPHQRQQIFLSHERQKLMLEIYNVTELVSITVDDPVMNRMYKHRLLNLQSELESLFAEFPSTNIADTVKSDIETGNLAEYKSVASAATNPKESKSVASAAAISKVNPTENKSVASIKTKVIQQERQGQEQREVKKSVEGKKSPSSTLERKISVEKSVIISPTAEQILATTYHEAADEGVKQIIVQEMSKPSTSAASINGKRQVLNPSMKKDDPNTKKTIGVIKVKAPMTMPEGYSFEAKVGEKVMMIKVPKGGVKKGQLFDYNAVEEKQMFIPLGLWRYPIFSCCAHGIIHPMCCNGFFCPQVALSQVMARVHLNACANPVLNAKARTNAISVLLASIALIMLHSILISLPFQSGGLTIVLVEVIPLAVLDLLLTFYFFAILIKTRMFVRQMYKIEGSVCDDVTSSVFCTCCTVIQMGHHTADYETYTGVCCSSTGLPPQLQALSPHSLPLREVKSPFSMC